MVRLATAQVNDVSFFFGNRESSHRLGGLKVSRKNSQQKKSSRILILRRNENVYE
jgi:hypothetical protein